MSGYTPLWKRILIKTMPFLFKKCPEENYHWFWDKTCYCVAHINGNKSYDFKTKTYEKDL